jgi:hypothetical protein
MKMEVFMVAVWRSGGEAGESEVEAVATISGLSPACDPTFEAFIYSPSSTPCLRRLLIHPSLNPMISTTRICPSFALACTTYLVFAPPSIRMHQRSHEP